MALRKHKDKDGQLQIGVTDEALPVKGVMLIGEDGQPYTAGGGGGGGSFDGQLTQDGADVSESNPLPSSVVVKNFLGDYEDVSSSNPLYVSDMAISSAILPNNAPTVDATVVMAGGVNSAGNAMKIPVEVEATDKIGSFFPIGGHNGSNAYGWHVNANGQGKVINDSLGDPADAVATNDTGTWSIPSLLKRISQSFTTLLSRVATLGQKTMSGSTPVVIASDQSKVSVQTDERPSASAGAITPSDSIGFGATSRGIYVGVGGDIVCIVNGLTVTFKNAMTGSIIPIQATRVNATGTTATNLIVLF